MLLPASFRENPYIRLMRLDKPVGSLLLLWPTLAALWMAAAEIPAWHLIVIFTLGTFVMRSAGCVINDYADRHVDGAVERTKSRPLVSGEVSPDQALALFAVLVGVAALLVIFLSWTTIAFAVGGLVLAALYPFTKRWTHLPQTILGAAFSWGILLAWTETGGTIPAEAGLYFAASVIWIVAYDTMYAMVDREDDLLAGIKSTAVLFGELDRLMIALLQSMAAVGLLLLAEQLSYHSFYYAGVAVVIALFIYQQYLIRKRLPADCLKAFKNNIWAGFALFCGTVAELAWQGMPA